ncbi:hypothetical protein ARMSODRAFT_323169 [Armillaria solidipes]|uniref:Uncharacterized protein n=1 Tax=Armillaria solidipes TaxID=1076256 RepID=A0A2H3B8K7_9AGAR|nr:hypothetical protein ARMSODRAFT_323169 [Armillaria solidipes]
MCYINMNVVVLNYVRLPRCSKLILSALQALVASSTICLSLPLSLLGHRSVHLDTFESDSVLRGNSFTDRVATLSISGLIPPPVATPCPVSGTGSIVFHHGMPVHYFPKKLTLLSLMMLQTNAMPLSLLLV